jgi:anaerobic C4-dicarboxylate transporter
MSSRPIEMVAARVVVALLLGALLGYAVGNSLNSDAERGRNLTLKQYVADFESHKEKLVSSEAPMGVSVVLGTIMVAVLFGVYELLVVGVGRALQAVSRRRSPGEPPPGLPPPPWNVSRR